jgi:hypothetical protein
MTPTELLLSTERAIGNGSLADMHERLISGSKLMRDVQDKRCALRGLIPLRALYLFGMLPSTISTDVTSWACDFVNDDVARRTSAWVAKAWT